MDKGRKTITAKNITTPSEIFEFLENDKKVAVRLCGRFLLYKTKNTVRLTDADRNKLVSFSRLAMSSRKMTGLICTNIKALNTPGGYYVD